MRAILPLAGRAAAIALFIVVVAFAQQPGGTPPAMSPEEQAMMKKWQAFATPGKEHALLAAKAGSWNVKVTMWNSPGSAPQVSDGTSEIAMILDGRYLQETVRGTFMGSAYEGHGLTGYDNIKKAFVSTWVDNMGTGIMTSEGKYDPATKTFTYMGMGPDAMTGKYVPMKGTETMKGPDQFTTEGYGQTKDGKGWWKSMQLEYTRKK